MKNIPITVKDKIAVNTGVVEYVCGNSDFVVDFTFDAEWDEFETKTARFAYNGGEYQDVVFKGTQCPVPVISSVRYIKVGVFAGNLHTTTPAYVNAKKSILCGSGVPDDPAPDVYAQIMALIQGLGDPDPEDIAAAVADYINKNPIEEKDPTVPAWAKAEKKPEYTAAEVGAVAEEDLQNAINTALAQAKASGEFDGQQGPQGEKGETGAQGPEGPQGEKGETGAAGKDATVDDTLTQSGQAADAAVVGQKFSELSEEIVTTAESKVSAHNTGTDTHSDIRLLISGLTDRLNALADSDDTTLDQLSEVVAYIKSNRTLIEAITTSKVSVADIIDNLTTNVANKPLSAAQGVALKALIDAISLPDKLPNPNALTFTGAVTGSYDGSAPLEVEIPGGGGGGAATEEWRLICDITLEENVSKLVISEDRDENPFSLSLFAALIESEPIVGATSNVPCGFMCSDKLSDISWGGKYGVIIKSAPKETESTVYSYVISQRSGDGLLLTCRSSLNYGTAASDLIATPILGGIKIVSGEFVITPPTITVFGLVSWANPMLGAGSRIRIWGVDAQ